MAARTIYGRHAVEAALRAGPERVERVWLAEGRRERALETIARMAAAAGVPVERVPRARLDRIAGDRHHQGVAARYRGPEPRGEGFLDGLLTSLEAPPLLLALDGVEDPRNLGACLRTAEAAGAHAVLAPRDRAVGLTPAAVKAAAGAAERLPFVQVTNLARTLERLRRDYGLRVVGADAGAPLDLYGADLRGPLALVLGAEGRGLRRLTRERCDALVRIPMAGAAESLNVSVAAAVLLYEALRQRKDGTQAGTGDGR